ncbi:hypothetical protein F4820DRAFT_425711 [Hypoxylon rubiginosum]|uniref:Uncharacterized protein n=1 Tax=Hypoxylon rubiginosum TaxID=110542 RepID=A0ACB9YXZ3_9PEZI|nr:hypothetical protein F4820DRAFT_425711 [Hypoxylon rubiginosum]
MLNFPQDAQRAGETHGCYDNSDRITKKLLVVQRDANNGKSVYVAELDVHFPELTLGQTLAFDASIMSNGLVHKYCGMVASLRGSSRYISQKLSLVVHNSSVSITAPEG